MPTAEAATASRIPGGCRDAHADAPPRAGEPSQRLGGSRLVEQPHRLPCRPPAAGTSTGRRRRSPAATAGLLEPATTSHTSRARAWRATSGDPPGAAAGEFGHGDDRPAGSNRRRIGNNELMCPSPPMPSRCTSNSANWQLFVCGGSGVDIVARLAVAGCHRVHIRRRDVDALQQRLTGLPTTLRSSSAAGETLVPRTAAPWTSRSRAESGHVAQQRDADRTAGQHDRGLAAVAIADVMAPTSRAPGGRRQFGGCVEVGFGHRSSWFWSDAGSGQTYVTLSIPAVLLIDLVGVQAARNPRPDSPGSPCGPTGSASGRRWSASRSRRSVTSPMVSLARFS